MSKAVVLALQRGAILATLFLAHPLSWAELLSLVQCNQAAPVTCSGSCTAATTCPCTEYLQGQPTACSGTCADGMATSASRSISVSSLTTCAGLYDCCGQPGLGGFTFEDCTLSIPCAGAPRYVNLRVVLSHSGSASVGSPPAPSAVPPSSVSLTPPPVSVLAGSLILAVRARRISMERCPATCPST